MWIQEVYDDHVIYSVEGAGTPATTYNRTYVIADDDVVTLGEPSEVKIKTEYVPVREGVAQFSGSLIEALDDDGWRWRVQVIQSGTSKNGNEYPLSVLHAAAQLYEGVPVFPEHDAKRRGFPDTLGVITESTPNARGIEATFEVRRSRTDVRDDMRQAWDVKGRTGKDLFGFSHSVRKFRSRPRAGRGRVVESIDEVESVDLVMSPAAGGALLAPIAEATDLSFDPLQEALMNVEQLLAKLREGKSLSMDELAFLQENIGGAELADALTEGRSKPAATVVVETDTSKLTEAEDRIAKMLDEAEKKASLAECRATLTTKLAESKLPEKVKTAIAEDFDGRIFESADLDKRIQRDTEMAASLAAVKPHGLGRVQVGDDARDQQRMAMDAFFGLPNDKGVKPFRSIKEAYIAIEGDTRFSYIDEGLARAILRESASVAPDDMRLDESIQTGTFAQLWGDSITRRMVREYNAPQYSSWRQIVSDFVPLNDFRTQRRMRMGGYGELPLVGEGAPYQPLASPGDEEATYALSKRGGTEDLTLEAIANDDVGAVRRLPVKLGRAAARTLYRAVWVTTIQGNATCTYDSTALFDASHNNTDTDALDATNLLAAENAMRNQTAYGESLLVLGAANMPRIIAIPNELRDTAFRLTQSPVRISSAGDSTEPNIFAGNGYTIIVVDEWTDATDWYLFADPQSVPILEVGFFNGREDPELFVQDQPTVGSTFTADKITYKMRHIWGIGILDHRGAYRNVASN